MATMRLLELEIEMIMKDLIAVMQDVITMTAVVEVAVVVEVMVGDFILSLIK